MIVDEAYESDEKDEIFGKEYFHKKCMDKYIVKDLNYYKIYNHRNNKNQIIIL